MSDLSEIRTLEEAFAHIRKDEIEGVEDLKQRFSDRVAQQFGGFLVDIVLAFLADSLGPGGRSAASGERGWSSQAINRMALLVDERVPDHLLRPEVPLGVYWQIWNSDIGFQAKVELTTKAINKGWSVADAKDAMGDESTRTGGTYLKGRAERVDGDRLIVSGPEIEAAAKLVAGRELSIRVLKE